MNIRATAGNDRTPAHDSHHPAPESPAHACGALAGLALLLPAPRRIGAARSRASGA